MSELHRVELTVVYFTADPPTPEGVRRLTHALRDHAPKAIQNSEGAYLLFSVNAQVETEPEG